MTPPNVTHVLADRGPDIHLALLAEPTKTLCGQDVASPLTGPREPTCDPCILEYRRNLGPTCVDCGKELSDEDLASTDPTRCDSCETQAHYDFVSEEGRPFKLTDAELGLLREALDSHVYWQLSDKHYRDSGYVRDPGSDDPEAVEAIKEANALAEKLGGSTDG